MKDYGKNKESSYLNYWDVNNLHGWSISQKLQTFNFKRVKDFIKTYDEKSKEGYFLEVYVHYPKNIHSYLPFLPERKKLKKFEKPVANLHDKKWIVIHIRSLKQVLNHGLILKTFIEWLDLIKINSSNLNWNEY